MVEPAAVICPSCDYIIDPTFLEGGEDLEEESTDHGLSGVDEDETTDPGTIAGRGGEATQVGPMANPYSGSARQAPPARVVPVAPAPAPRNEPVDVRALRPPESPSEGQLKSVVTETSPRVGSVKASQSGSGISSGRDRRAVDDPGSRLMEDYDQLFSDLWRRFVAVPVADKILLCGLVLASLSVLLPWRGIVFDNGLYEVRSGLMSGGWLNLLLAGASGAVVWYRLARGFGHKVEWMVGQTVLAGVGLLWSTIAFFIGLRIAATAPNFGGPTAGPSYGVVISMLAWSVVLAGAVILLMDLAGSKGKGRGGGRR